MNKKEFITEKHLKQRTMFRTVGPIILGIGFLCSLIAAIDLFTLSPFEEPEYFWLFFIGFPLLAIGFFICSLGFGSTIVKYQSREIAPIAKDTINYLANETKDGIETIAQAVQKGKSTVVEAKRCNLCKELNKIEAKFCNECGNPL